MSSAKSDRSKEGRCLKGCGRFWESALVFDILKAAIAGSGCVLVGFALDVHASSELAWNAIYIGSAAVLVYSFGIGVVEETSEPF